MFQKSFSKKAPKDMHSQNEDKIEIPSEKNRANIDKLRLV